MGKEDKDTLDRVIAFLQKREGIDKTLKLLRYTARFVAAVSPKDTEAHKRFTAFEKSVGVSRKAFRLGKFLQDLNNYRHANSTGWLALLELLAYGGEGIYYFIEQLVWLIKTGAVDKSLEAELSAISAWAEATSYVANIWLSIVKIQDIRRQTAAARQALDKLVQDEQQKDSGSEGSSTVLESNECQALRRKLQLLQVAHRLKAMSIIQDLSDSLLALNDIRGGKDKLLGHPVTLALAGLVSGTISAHKNWTS